LFITKIIKMKMFHTIAGVSAAAVLLLASCKKHIIEVLPVTETAGMSNLKIVYASAYTTNFTVQLKVNDERVSNSITYTTPFPGGGLNTQGSNWPLYLGIAPGSNKITLSQQKVGTNVDSIVRFNGSVSLAADKYYTAYLTDTAANTQVVLLEDSRTPPANGTSRFKFVNLMPNLPAADLYFGTDLVAANVAYKAVSPNFTIPRGSVGSWSIRPAGAAPTTTALATYAMSSIPNQQIYTIFSRGYSGQTGNRVPAISLHYN
jgi:hypothetical protein